MNRRQWSAALAVGAGAAGLGAWWRLQQGGGPAARPPVDGNPARTAGGPPASGASAAAAVQAFWSYSVEQPDGSTLALSRFRGRPLVVNFWATWCPPCIRELPVIDAFARAQGADGWQVLGLAIDRRDAVVEFLRKQPVSYAIGLAGFDGTQWSRDLGNAQGGLPFTAAFDAQGALRHRRLGEISAEELASWTRG